MRFRSSALALLLVMKAFLLLTCLLRVYAYSDGEMNRNGITEKESFTTAHHQEEVVDAFSTATKMKMALPSKVDIPSGATPQVISGRYNNNYNNVGLGESQDQFIHQEQKTKKLEPNTQKNSAIFGSPRQDQVHNKNIKTKECEESKAMPTQASLESPDYDHNTHTHPKTEKQRLLLEATKDIVNLMHKDYKGVDRPRRKPPINNHVPIH